MLLTIHQSTRFRRDVKRLGKQGAELSKLESVIRTLVAQSPLDERLRDHALTGNWRGYRDCHIQPDWLLLYRVVDDELQLARMGSHADLFGK